MVFSRSIYMLIIAAAAAVTVGCSSGSESAQNQQQKNTAAAVENQSILPEGSPSFTGKVKDIVGNEVTVYKAEVGQGEAVPKDASAGQAQAQVPAQSQNQNQSGGGRVPGNMGFNIKFAEETSTFIIPVGTPIAAMQRGTGGVSLSRAGLTDIKKESILRVWEKDGEVSFVQLTGGGGTAGNRQGTGGSRQGTGTGTGNTQGMGGGPQVFMGGNR